MSSLLDLWPFFLAATIPIAQAAAAVHLVLRKRDVRAAVGWMGLIWLAPVVGVVLYYLLGINRIRRKAQALRGERAGYEAWLAEGRPSGAELEAQLGPAAESAAELVPLGDRVTGRPLLSRRPPAGRR